MKPIVVCGSKICEPAQTLAVVFHFLYNANFQSAAGYSMKPSRKYRACVFAMLLAVPTGVLCQAAGPRVKTRQGVVEGKQDAAVRAFLGIPYAEPPVGELRWRPPVQAAHWDGVRKATDFGAHCLQGRVYDDMNFRDSGGARIV